MADKLILVDTSILIDYYRKTDKENSVWVSLVRENYSFAVSAVSKYEIFTGANLNQLTFWNNVFQAINVIPFDEIVVDTAVLMNTQLKKKGLQFI